MIIIGEKINGSIPAVALAIRERNSSFIRNLAIRQTRAGVAYLDIAAGTGPETERETLAWLIDTVQDATDTPLCIDSPDCQVLLDMMPLVKKPGILNSVSEEKGKCEALLPRIAGTEWKVIALTCDSRGISSDPDVKFDIAVSIVEKAARYGIGEDRLFIDPLITALCVDGATLSSFTETLTRIKNRFPKAHITGGLSNSSFGMPFRKAINSQFLCLAVNAGMDSPIMDPCSGAVRAALYAEEALLGRDRNCRNYLTAFRKGLFGPKNTSSGGQRP